MFDGVVYLIFGIFTLIAFLRGFIKELFSIIGHIAAIYITYKFNNHFTEIFSNIIPSKNASSIVAYIIIYITSIIIFWILNTLISITLMPIRLGFLDRFLGIILGISKSYFICFTIYTAIVLIYPMLESIDNSDINNNKTNHTPPWVKNSNTYIIFKFTQDALDNSLSDFWVDGFIETLHEKLNKKNISNKSDIKNTLKENNQEETNITPNSNKNKENDNKNTIETDSTIDNIKSKAEEFFENYKNNDNKNEKENTIKPLENK